MESKKVFSVADEKNESTHTHIGGMMKTYEDISIFIYTPIKKKFDKRKYIGTYRQTKM